VKAAPVKLSNEEVEAKVAADIEKKGLGNFISGN
jgi:hypothetical protein